MTDLETRIHAWVGEQTAGVAPITLDEIHDRATTIPIDADPLPQPPRRLNPRPLAIAAAILLVAIVGAALLLLDQEPEQDVVTETEQGLAEVAGLVPDDFGAGYAVITHQEGARRAAGIDRPPVDASAEENDAYLTALLDAGQLPFDGGLGLLLGPPESSRFQALRDELGIELAQITGTAMWGGPPDSVTLLVGRFDPDSIDTAVRNLPAPWDDALVIEEHRGVSYYSWFPDFEIGVPRALDTNALGMAMRLAVVDNIVVITHSTDSMTSTLDHILDDAPSDLAPLFGRLDTTGQIRHTANIYGLGGTIDGANTAVVNIRPVAGEATDVDAWQIHISATDDAAPVEEQLEALVDTTANADGWEEGWRDLVRIDTDGQIVSITIEGNASTRAPEGQVRETVGERLMVQILNRLVGSIGDADPAFDGN